MRKYTDSTSINDLINSAMDKVKTIADSGTIVGETITTDDGTSIIPISKVTVGFVVGGGEYADLSSRRVANHFPMSGGSSGGMSISPVGFLILLSNGEVDFVNVENKTLYQTVLNIFNSLLAKMEKKEECSCDETPCQDADIQNDFADQNLPGKKDKKKDKKKEKKKNKKSKSENAEKTINFDIKEGEEDEQ